MKSAPPGRDPTIKNEWKPQEKVQNFNPNRNEPEYSKIIEAEEIKSQIDTEAEFNRDPALVRYKIEIQVFLYIVTITISEGGV